MTEANRFENISNTKLAFASVVIVSILISVFCFAYSELATGENTIRSLIYTLSAVSICAALLFGLFTIQRYTKVIYALVILMGLESLFSAALTVSDGQHHVATARTNYEYARYVNRFRGKFSHHPILAGVPTANFRQNDVSHTAQSTRTTASPEDPNAPVVVTIGGSTTYGGSNDQQTWAWMLAERANLNVFNLGVPGYSSVEHVVQTAFWTPEFKPRCAVYYVGWNDIRSVGVSDIKPDYSDFHMKRQGMQLGVSPHALQFYEPNALENIALIASYINWRRTKLDRFLAGSFPWWRDTDGAGALTTQVDQSAMQYYIQNMETIITLNKERGVRTILIPQVMNFAMLTETEEEARPWTPFIAATAVKDVITEYNLALTALADGDGVWALDHVLDYNWRNDHFVDEGHFSPAGSESFANLVADEIGEICR